MTTFTSEDREKVEKEPIPFYGYCYLTNPSTEDKNPSVDTRLKRFKVEYRVDDSSEDSEE
ncbi:hypothetical protein [Polynucleobacter sp. AP-Melu-500A-A1]|uniref:hypothetical protein n=1 Tax=Polynucleobacter sp. AP-Melu-500A-A1 TaxID=2576929 RepID=UPI001C0AD3FB|nr:hypothetical protein [Polynucleobacter sp. AP-Melu-500A-A1]MBU3631304.1 hypothetical protein [Polynucleobacter sp. AP-Melu-500A-A1]